MTDSDDGWLPDEPPQHRPPGPFEDQARKTQELIIAAYGLRRMERRVEEETLSEAERDAGASVVAAQVLALRPDPDPADRAEFTSRLADALRNARPGK